MTLLSYIRENNYVMISLVDTHGSEVLPVGDPLNDDAVSLRGLGPMAGEVGSDGAWRWDRVSPSESGESRGISSLVAYSDLAQWTAAISDWDPEYRC